MALLDWKDSLAASGVRQEASQRLENAISGVAAAGAPVLYGFREKYDDPWSTPWSMNEETLNSVPLAPTIPWTELNTAITEICTTSGCKSPWEATSSVRRTDELTNVLGTSGRIIALVITSSTAGIYLINRDGYERTEIPAQQVVDLSVLFSMHKAGAESAETFRNHLAIFTDVLSELLAEPLNRACAGGTSGFIILPEPIFFPITGALMAHPEVRTLMNAGSLSIRTCPIIHVGRNGSNRFKTISACKVVGDDLKLNDAELDDVAKTMVSARTSRNALSGKDSSQKLFGSDVLHIAAHGTPISNLRDAFFSLPDDNRPMSNFYGLQWEATTGRTEVVFLNSCFSGDTLNWNAMRNFKTSEQIGISSMFLLNRKAAVIATAWGTFDSSAYIFAHLFYSNVANDVAVETAFAKAAAALYDMDMGDVRKSLDTILPEDLREEKQARFTGTGHPFRHPCVSGNYQMLSLLPPHLG